MKKVLFIIAFIILSNPIISNVDILPDFLGYALIMLALSKPTYYDQKALSAYRCARNMLFMSVLRLVSFYLTTVIIDASLSLVFSFALFVVEMVFGIPFIIKLFDYFGDRALKTDNKFALKVVDKFKIVTIVLFSLRLLLSTLPDFILLTVTDPLNDMSRFRPVLIVLALLAVFGLDSALDLSGVLNLPPVVSSIGSLVVFGLIILSLLRFSIWKKRKKQ